MTLEAPWTDVVTEMFVYGVVGADAQVPEGLLGLDDAPVRIVEVHGDAVGALVSELSVERPPGRRADLLAYSRVVDTVATSAPVAPVRFGTLLPDEPTVVEDLLVPGTEWFTQLLADLAGRAQFNLRATYVEEAVLAEVVRADPEIARLHELTRVLPADAAYGERVRLGELVARALEAKREGDTEMLMDVVAPHVVAASERPGGGGDHLLDVALLVDLDRQQALEDTLEGLAEEVHERIRLRLVGPIAAYDFVGES
jgi:hypothetical protein